jgi:hypothetical protein
MIEAGYGRSNTSSVSCDHYYKHRQNGQGRCVNRPYDGAPGGRRTNAVLIWG